MPEPISLERPRENQPILPSVELTEEDRVRIGTILEEVQERFIDTFSPQRRDIELRGLLRSEGEKAAKFILEKIEGCGSQSEIFHLLLPLKYCASPPAAKNIGDILLYPEAGLSPNDRSSKGRLLEILSLVGIEENIEQLVNFAKNSLEVRYTIGSSDFNRGDVVTAVETLRAIELNSKVAISKINDAMAQINDSLLLHGKELIPPLGDRERQGLVENLEWMRRRFEESFTYQPRPTHENSAEAEEFDNYEDYGIQNDEARDEEIEDDYKNLKELEIESRLETIKRLRHEISKEKGLEEETEEDKTKFLRRHWLGYREENPSPYAPTLGIEIEIRDQSLDAEDFYKKSNLIEKYRKTPRMGVPSGYDAFWEFAHRPVHYYHTLSKEVAALIEMGLINQAYTKHSLHLTIGGITTYDKGGYEFKEGGTYLLARALEATGYSITGGRLLRPYLTGRMSWDAKGAKGGVLERFPEDIALGVPAAVEMRTFQLQGITGLDRLLKSAFLLGAALKAYQREAVTGEKLDETETKLAEVWGDFSNSLAAIFEEYNLKNPGEAWVAPNSDGLLGPAKLEVIYAKGKSDFIPLAKLLEEARLNPQSNGAEFVKKVRGLIIKARKKVKDIIYPKNKT